MSEIGMPIKVMLAVFISVIVIIAALIALAATGIGGSGVSTQLIATNTALQAALPFVGILVAGGFTLIAMERRRN